MDENKCTECSEKGKTCIPFFVHENSMMHKDMDNERMHETLQRISEKNNRTILTVCITFVMIIIIFVTAYTVRTSIWLDTINKMNDYIVVMANRYTDTGVDNAVHQHPN